MRNRDILLELQNINFDYGNLPVLHDLNLTIPRGEIHAIVGEHGAGKTSMGKLISGMEKPKSGCITFREKIYSQLSLKTSLGIGIRMVYQESVLNDYFSSAENILLADNIIPSFSLSYKSRTIKQAQELVSGYGFNLDVSTLVKNLNLSDRTVVDIIKNIYKKPDLLILDEALEKLSTQSLEKIIELLLRLNREGMSILFITHRIDDIYNFAHRLSIIKSGRILLTGEVRNIDKVNLVKMAYTQIPADMPQLDLEKEFYQLLRYNEAILQNLPVNLVVTDDMFRIKLINNFCKKNYSILPEKYINRNIGDFFSGSSDSVISMLTEALSMETEKQFYQTTLRINNLETVNNLKIFPILDGTTYIGSILIIEDITEYDKMQKQMILSEKLASIGLLAAGVAHEINNPLEIIYNYLSYLKSHFNNDNLQEIIIKLQEEMAYINNIVSNLVNFSDVQRVVYEDVEINHLIKSIIDLVNFSAKKQNVMIYFRSEKHAITVKANSNEIKQVILNLLKNSFEAMPDGGTIDIRSDIKTIDGKPAAEITLVDSGGGIEADNMNQIFLPFFSTKKKNENNKGLGLSISFRIIEKYKGTINVENPMQGGARFKITIPVELENS